MRSVLVIEFDEDIGLALCVVKVCKPLLHQEFGAKGAMESFDLARGVG